LTLLNSTPKNAGRQAQPSLFPHAPSPNVSCVVCDGPTVQSGKLVRCRSCGTAFDPKYGRPLPVLLFAATDDVQVARGLGFDAEAYFAARDFTGRSVGVVVVGHSEDRDHQMEQARFAGDAAITGGSWLVKILVLPDGHLTLPAWFAAGWEPGDIVWAFASTADYLGPIGGAK